MKEVKLTNRVALGHVVPARGNQDDEAESDGLPVVIPPRMYIRLTDQTKKEITAFLQRKNLHVECAPLYRDVETTLNYADQLDAIEAKSLRGTNLKPRQIRKQLVAILNALENADSDLLFEIERICPYMEGYSSDIYDIMHPTPDAIVTKRLIRSQHAALVHGRPIITTLIMACKQYLETKGKIDLRLLSDSKKRAFVYGLIKTFEVHTKKKATYGDASWFIEFLQIVTPEFYSEDNTKNHFGSFDAIIREWIENNYKHTDITFV